MVPPDLAAPPITVAVCTHNRADLLAGCLRAVLAQDMPCEVLVVDNASTDATPAVARQFPVRYVVEPTPGLSRARNRAWREARAPIVAYLDDDARPRPGWLAHLLDTFAAQPRAACVGGRIELELPASRPAWYGPQFAGYFSAFDLGGAAPRRVSARHEIPFGANIAFRRAALEGAGGFSEALGRTGGDSAGGEEIDLALRLMAAGEEVWFDPRAAVTHVIAPDRLRWNFILRSARAAGRNWAAYERGEGVGADAVLFVKWLAGLLRPSWPRVCFALATLRFLAAKIRRKFEIRWGSPDG